MLLNDRNEGSRFCVALVAIAKNESLYLTEWIAHHFVVGFDKIYIYNNDSNDRTMELLSAIALIEPRLSVVNWPTSEHSGPQEAAYNDAARSIHSDWIAFLDIDEFIVPWRDQSIAGYLKSIPDDISSVHINWRGFGSNGRLSPIYDSVIETFTACSQKNWGNNHHYKTIVRGKAIDQVFTHYARTKYGRRVLTDFSDVKDDNNGIGHAVVYNGIQINHYQSKTFSEFRQRMNNGNAYYAAGVAARYRESSYRRFLEIDQNDETDSKMSAFISATKTARDVIEKNLPAHLQCLNLKGEWLNQILAGSGAAESGLNGPGQRYIFVSHHGTMLGVDPVTRQVCQRSIEENRADFLPLSAVMNSSIDKLAGLRIKDHLEQDVNLPDQSPVSEIYFAPGYLPNTVSLKIKDRYLTAQIDGRITTQTEKCLEWESFYLKLV